MITLLSFGEDILTILSKWKRRGLNDNADVFASFVLDGK